LRYFPESLAPTPLRKWMLSSRAVALSFRVSAFSTRPGIPGGLTTRAGCSDHRIQQPKPSKPVIQTTERLSWGLCPFSVCSARSPLNPGLPHPARSALRVSHPLSGFLLPTPPRLFSSWNAPGIRPSEPSPPEEPYASRRPYPLVVSSAAPLSMAKDADPTKSRVR